MLDQFRQPDDLALIAALTAFRILNVSRLRECICYLLERDDRSERFEEATRRVVQNILKSYTGFFDLFSELLQNALDAMEKKTAVARPRPAISHNSGFRSILPIGL